MKKSTFKTCVTSLFLAGLANAQAQGSKPNIIYILADDLGYGDLSCYNENSKISTPNIDRLASQGMSFTDAHAGAALSTPSRYGILTGRYCFRSSLKSGVLGAYDPPLIESSRTTVGGFLQQNGYNTACIGKWHLGFGWPKSQGGQINFADSIKEGPVDRGFDYYYGVDCPNEEPYCFIENKKTIGIPNVQKPASMYGYAGLMVPGWSLENLLPGITNKAVDYINNASTVFKRDSQKPFFLYFALTAPHTPIAPIDSFKGTSKAYRYGDFIQQLDWEVGKVLQAIKDQGLEDNTIVIFSSDNGPMPWDGTDMQGTMNSVLSYGHNPSYIYRGKKSDIWEAGHRIPFIVRWPGQIAANTKSNETICEIDFMATCAGILNKSLPSGAGEDSYNLLPILKGESYNHPFRKVTMNHSGSGTFAIRQGNWKLILGGGSGGFTNPTTDAAALALGWPLIQLYDLSVDIGEKTNLQATYPDKVNAMTILLDSLKKGSIIDPSGSVYANNILEFDASKANSYVDCSYNAAFMPVNFTLELWANFTAAGGTILSCGASPGGFGNQGYTLRLDATTMKVEFVFGIGSGAWQTSTSNNAVSLNAWNHISIVYNGTSVQMYLNGLDNGSTTFTSPMVPSSQKFYIGEHPTFTGKRISGELSDVRVWNYARTQSEIQSTMNGFVNGNESGLVANWKLDEGNGTMIHDLTSHFNATRDDGTTWIVNKIIGVSDVIKEISTNPINVWPTMLKAGQKMNIDWNSTDVNPVIRISSANGQLIEILTIDDEDLNQIQTGNLKSGLYIMDIFSNKKHQFTKFVIK